MPRISSKSHLKPIALAEEKAELGKRKDTDKQEKISYVGINTLKKQRTEIEEKPIKKSQDFKTSLKKKLSDADVSPSEQNSSEIVTEGSFLNKLNRISEMEFHHRFQDAKKITTKLHICSDKQSISSIDVGECITLFAVEKNANTIISIMGYHVENCTKKATIERKLESYFKSNYSYEIYLIGGDKSSEKLLEDIYSAIKTIYGSQGRIMGEFLNPTENTEYTFICVNLQMDGTFTYCLNN